MRAERLSHLRPFLLGNKTGDSEIRQAKPFPLVLAALATKHQTELFIETCAVTTKKQLGNLGEALVSKLISCPRCKRNATLKRLPENFRCADIICDFCGYLAQVKTVNSASLTKLPKFVQGAAWAPQKQRMESGIYFPLFLVLVTASQHAIYYLPADLQNPDLFVPRNPLSRTARKPGWQGFRYFLESAHSAFVRLK